MTVDHETETETEIEERCTCGVPDGDEDHLDSCELWDCAAWLDGELVWYQGALEDPEELWGWGTEAPTEVKLAVENPDDSYYECSCLDANDTTVTFATRHSAMCMLQEHKAWMNAECEWDHATRSFVYDVKPKPTSSSYGSSLDHWGGYAGMGKSCVHDGTKALEFPNGVKVYPSSSYDTKKRDTLPDFALYLETSRMPYSIATYIPWRDYGLPEVNFQHAAHTIIDVYEMAKRGLTVEVGCIGAHGRTGTVLACMAVLAGVDPDAAVEWVQTNHCPSAVEGERQRWFIAWFSAFVNGTEAPPTPPVPPPLPPAKKNEAPQSTQLPFTNKVTTLKTAPKTVSGPLCPECVSDLDAFPLGGYLCWNNQCSYYQITKSSPISKKLGFKKGRKKHR